MRSLLFSVVILAAATTAFGQQWEFGAVGGGSLLSDVSVSGAAGKATAGFAPGAAFGAFVGENLYTHLTGELHYEYLQSDLRLSSGGQTAQFTGGEHAVHFDMVYHTNRKESRTQFFASVGGGIKVFRGTGAPEAYQALSQFGYFTETQAVKPMVSVGAGLTFQLAPRIFLRAEVRDFITAFPTALITPAPGMKFGSLLNDIVPLVGITYVH
jgi:Outer membrane protein beta-barrel domain